MTQFNPNQNFRNLARGNENYRHLRWRVYNLLVSKRDQPISPLTPFLSKRFFRLTSNSPSKKARREPPLHALSIFPRDFDVLRELETSTNPTLTQDYLTLLSDFITSNSESVDRLAKIDAQTGRYVLSLDTEKMSKIQIDIKPEDKQSLFTFKLYCALHAHSHEQITDYFASIPHSDWVRHRFLYPLLFYFINLQDDSDLVRVFEQIFPELNEDEAEKNLIVFLLGDSLDLSYSLAYKCYVGLLCHPYDALNILLNHYEFAIAQDYTIHDEQIKSLKRISNNVNSTRLNHLIARLSGEQVTSSKDASNTPICNEFGLPDKQRDFFEAFFSLNSQEPSSDDLSGLYTSLHRLRWSRFPMEEDFKISVLIARRYGFSEVGRFLGVLLTSIYMVERETEQRERVLLIRQIQYLGTVTPFTLTSPRGREYFSNVELTKSYKDLETIEQFIPRTFSSISDRCWIKILHWQLSELEQQMRLEEWFDKAYKHIPLSGNSRFLSGIDWRWIEDVLKIARIKPFRGSESGVYVLLIRALEQRQREPNTLRLALAPFVGSDDHLSDLIDNLTLKYQAGAIAFLRFFLTPSMIMKMNLENNYTAALSERLNALELCCEVYGYDAEIITRDQFEQEQRTLTNALLYMRVGAAQFEIPWESYRDEALANAEDLYKTYAAFNKTYNSIPLLSEARKKTTQTFSNKKYIEYVFQNNEWPLVATIVDMIDTFLSHPSYGIEAVLAIRIRHDNLRRELAIALGNLEKTRMNELPLVRMREWISAFEEPLYEVLQAWIDRYMHTGLDEESGLFKFIPNQSEMTDLVKEGKKAENKEELAEIVISWIKKRLSDSLAVARNHALMELKAEFTSTINSAAREFLTKWGTPSNDVVILRDITDDVISRRCDEFSGWFRSPTQTRSTGLNYFELKGAVEGRFKNEIASQRLFISLKVNELRGANIRAEMIRAHFDLWSELTLNATKYSGLEVTRILVWEFSKNGTIGLCFSSRSCEQDKNFKDSISYHDGQPRSANEPMLKSGKSGLKKVAGLAAAISGQNANVKVVHRKSGFHVFVPLMDNRSLSVRDAK